MQVGDVDGDGDLDVVIPRMGTGLVWYENPLPKDNLVANLWSLWSRHLIDLQGGHDVEVGDMDKDGRLDVVIREGATRVFLQKSPGIGFDVLVLN